MSASVVLANLHQLGFVTRSQAIVSTRGRSRSLSQVLFALRVLSLPRSHVRVHVVRWLASAEALSELH